MRRRVLVILRPALLLVFAAAAGGAQTTDYVVRESAQPCLRLRAQPDTDAERIACLAPGTRVTELESIPYWRRVRLADAREGWVAKLYLEIAPEAADRVAIPADAWLEVHFVDVGQGDAVWIHTYDDGIDGNGIFEGRNIVIDGGPDTWPPANQLVTYLLERGHPDAVIDALIVTHPHSDHYYGARGVLREFQVRAYYDPGMPSSNSTYAALLDSVRVEEVEGQRAAMHLGREQFGTLQWGGELAADVLYAWPGNATGLGSGGTRVNNASIVLRLEYGSHSFLLVGDLEGKARDDDPGTARYGEARLLSDVPPERLRATVLKLAHHGSETSSTLPFLQAVNPEIVVVPSGRKNYSGVFLPDASVLDRVCALGDVTLVRTDQDDEEDDLAESDDADGDHVVIRTNGREIQVQAMSGGSARTVMPC